MKYRSAQINIIWWTSSGLKVPNSCVLYNGNKATVTRIRAGYTDDILIKVLMSNENYSIIENYTSSELRELGYTLEEIRNMKSISLYDEVRIK